MADVNMAQGLEELLAEYRQIKAKLAVRDKEIAEWAKRCGQAEGMLRRVREKCAVLERDVDVLSREDEDWLGRNFAVLKITQRLDGGRTVKLYSRKRLVAMKTGPDGIKAPSLIHEVVKKGRERLG